MPEAVTQTNLELEQIHSNIKIMSDFVQNLTTKLSSYFDDLNQHYTKYLKLLKSSTSTPATSPSSPGYSFKYVDSEYHKLTKKLSKIIEIIGNDFLEIHDSANKMVIVYEGINRLKDEIEISKKLPDSLEKMALIHRLNSQYGRKVMSYNNLAASFNAYASQLTFTKQYLNDGLIIYSPNSSNKKYSLSIKRIIDWFKNLASPDGVSLLRGEIISRMTKSYTTDLNSLINTPPLTSISVMNPSSMPQQETPNQPPSNLKFPYPSFMGARVGTPQAGTRFADIPQVGTPYTLPRMPTQQYGRPGPSGVSAVVKEEPEDMDEEVEMIP